MELNILSRDFYERDTQVVAKDLLGKLLIRKINNNYLVGLITETEAYRSDDEACHAYKGQNIKNKSLFGPVGHTYVYLSYGLHYCLNIVSGNKKFYPAGGVLIRAILPINNINIMIANRKTDKHLANGPGKLTQALNINLTQNNIDVTSENSDIFISTGYEFDESCIESTPRIGITKAIDKLWRFIVKPECISKAKLNTKLKYF